MSEILCSPRRNSQERFLHHFFKVLGVVQSTECFVLNVKPCAGFLPALSTRCQKCQELNLVNELEFKVQPSVPGGVLYIYLGREVRRGPSYPDPV